MASSSSLPYSRWVYDVFLSFRGEDVRKNFLDHLYFALDQKGIFTFKDDEKLNKGKSIGPELLKSIEESRFAIIVFSVNYASSSWCLDELVKIVECSKSMGQTVMPVFYNVDPSDVRKQTGHFGNAFAKHEESEKVGVWKKTLEEAANISGWDVHKTDDGHESKCIQRIVIELLCKLGDTFSSAVENLVGIESRVEKVNSLLSTGSDDIRFVGIWGLSGIGKTTTARTIFERICNQFQGYCFLHEVRDAAAKHGLKYLQRELLSQILMVKNLEVNNVFDGVHMIRGRLRSRRVLIVLDDVDSFNQLYALAGKHDWFGSGSRIIITTRDKQILVGLEECRIHEMGVLNYAEAIQLFSWKAFKKIHPPKDYEELPYSVVHYAGGLPLALRVLGSALYGRDKATWRSAVDRLREKGPGREILEVLKIGFDGLEDTEKEIFLDIACFFKGEEKDYVTRILNSSNLHPDMGISVLIQKSLIYVSQNRIWMHQLVQETGWHIVRRSSPDEPGKRSRLWLTDDIKHVLKRGTVSVLQSISFYPPLIIINKKVQRTLLVFFLSLLILCAHNCQGTENVKGIMLDFLKAEEILVRTKAINARKEEINVSTEDFRNMNRLRLLIIYNVCVPRGLEYLSDELRWLKWYGFPSKSLPPGFQAEKLVGLEMHYSRVTEVWKGKKVLDKLKYMDFSHSQKLIRTPDLTEVPNLEELILEGCTGLKEVHPSFGLLKRLVLINLKHCKSLQKFPEILENLENISKVYLGGTDIKELPSSIERLTSIVLMNLRGCKNLRSLPSTICMLKHLKTLILSGCSKLDKLPEDLGSLKCLQELYLDGTAVEMLPSSIGHLTNLREIIIRDCKNLTSLPSTICMLEHIRVLDLCGCSKLDKLPEDVGNLERLEKLLLDGTAITQPPISVVHLKNLEILSLRGCGRGTMSQSQTSIVSYLLSWIKCQDSISLVLPPVSSLSSLKRLDLRDCNLLGGAIPSGFQCLVSLEELFLGGSNVANIPTTSISELPQLTYLSLVGCKMLEELPELPYKLNQLFADECPLLKINTESLFTKNKVLECASFSNCWRLFDDGQSITTFIKLWLRMLQAQGLSVRHDERSICLPGIEIPEWFSNKNTGPSVSMKLPPHWYNNKVLGFALCVVFERIYMRMKDFFDDCLYLLYFVELEFFFITHNKSNAYYRKIPRKFLKRAETIESDHVCLIYTPFDEFEDFPDNPNEFCEVEVSISKFDDPVKMCGIGLVYEDDVKRSGNGSMGLFPPSKKARLLPPVTTANQDSSHHLLS